jgi:hypothetical protein
MDASTTAGTAVGDATALPRYKEGRAKFEAAAKLADTRGLKAILKDDSIPGMAIADSLLNIGTPSKSKNPAKIASVLVETLGEGSDALAKTRAGVLARMLNGVGDDPTAQTKLLTMLEENEQMIGDLFTPDQVSEIAKIRVALQSTKGARKSDAAYEKNASLISAITSKLNSPMKRAGVAAVGAGVLGGHPGYGMGAAALSLGADALTSAPAKRAMRATGRALGPAVEGTAQAVGRYAANPRDAMIDQLGGRR